MQARELADNVPHIVWFNNGGEQDGSTHSLDLPGSTTCQDQEGSCAHRMTYKGEAGLARDLYHSVNHGGKVVDAQLMKGEPPELCILVRVETRVVPAVLCPPEVAQPDVIAEVGEEKSQAVRA